MHTRRTTVLEGIMRRMTAFVMIAALAVAIVFALAGCEDLASTPSASTEAPATSVALLTTTTLLAEVTTTAATEPETTTTAAPSTTLAPETTTTAAPTTTTTQPQTRLHRVLTADWTRWRLTKPARRPFSSRMEGGPIVTLISATWLIGIWSPLGVQISTRASDSGSFLNSRG
jgi:cytoskeletal protein RodZ